MTRDAALADLADRWRSARPAELANAQSYLIELCDALGVEKPRPAGTGYEFEFPVRVVHRDGTEAVNRVDLFKEGCFLLEAKDEGEGTDVASGELRLRKAFGQASSYAAFVPGGPPPYLMVLDVGRTLRLWDRWSGSYGGFQGAVRTVDLTRLAGRPDDVAFLRAVWEDPSSLDPSARAAAVTKEIAGKLATLAARLERSGEDQERVARFLIRCVFTMFAEDVGLLADQPFQRAVAVGLAGDPQGFDAAVADLWAAMDEGKRFGVNQLLRFNGHFFRDRDVVHLSRDDLAVLFEAAKADWADVEPSIFGTLLTRALDPVERHRLGAEFTPRAYVERLVRPTIEEPVRERWTMVQAEVLQLREKAAEAGSKAARSRALNRAIERLREFHDHLRGIRVLDPACGSGNFLYVSLSILKEIELEVIRELEEITGQREAAVEEVGPWQFHGIEVKPWAREVAELCLWVGHHQWWRRTHGHAQPPEPVLRDTGTLECRDAVLAWDDIRVEPSRARRGPTPRIVHAVTGELVPDPDATLPYHEYIGARQAAWPEADFIVGNPPYMGQQRMREEFGEGYVDALWSAYPTLPRAADYVMYWWHRAAQVVADGRALRAGLITTSSITQTHNRKIVQSAAKAGAEVHWAAPDHPWVDDADGAAVRVAMTVVSREPSEAVRIDVDADAIITRTIRGDSFNLDLTVHADVPRASSKPLFANQGIATRGVELHGEGFLLPTQEGEELLAMDPRHAEIVRPYINGRDIAQRARGAFVVDFGLRSEDEAKAWPILYDRIRSLVRPHRVTNRMPRRAEYWWQLGVPGKELREVVDGLARFIVTPSTSRHRFFIFFDPEALPDQGLQCIGSEDALHLGVLSSTIHVTWALAAGGRLGVGNDPRYNKTKCFDAFPFPEPAESNAERIRAAAERLEDHRNAALDRDESVTMTGMYNVVQKLRTGGTLTPKERKIHEIAACGVLHDVHDQLDRLVADAYGWPWPMDTDEILARLVALHDERVEEESRGHVRWLRREYQLPRFGDRVGAEVEADLGAEPDDLAADQLPDWPTDTVEQLTALHAVVAERPRTIEEATRQFKGAVRAEVEKHLDALRVLGVVGITNGGEYRIPASTATRDDVGTGAADDVLQ